MNVSLPQLLFPLLLTLSVGFALHHVSGTALRFSLCTVINNLATDILLTTDIELPRDSLHDRRLMEIRVETNILNLEVGGWRRRGGKCHHYDSFLKHSCTFSQTNLGAT